MNQFNQITQSPEFKRQTGNFLDTSAKLSFKWLGIAISAIIGFITSMARMVIGK